jgi:CubicO group peptidase (beta-lactamase class C family)
MLTKHHELPGRVRRRLEAAVERDAPGVTYVFVRGDGAVGSFAGGRADAASNAPIDPGEPMPIYSMTKAITALATLEWLERRGVGLDGDVRELVPSFPYRAHRVRVGDLLAHTAGLGNPMPLGWVHSPEAHPGFDEGAARAKASAHRARPPGIRYSYSNLGYWWLGAVLEALAGQSFERVLEDLGLVGDSAGVVTTYPAGARCMGHVRRFGMLRLAGALVTPRWVWAGSVGRWARIHRHYVDGLAYGGLLGTAAGLAPFLERLLAVVRGAAGEPMRRAVCEAWKLADGRRVPMTAALHIGALGPHLSLFKEGGGAGFHSELRIYPERNAGSAMIANASEIDVKRLMDDVDIMLVAD